MTQLQFLIFLRPARPDFSPESATESEMARVGEHWNYFVEAHRLGKVVVVGRTQEPPFIGLAIIEAQDRAEAEKFMLADPAVAGGVFTATLHPYKVSLLKGEPAPG